MTQTVDVSSYTPEMQEWLKKLFDILNELKVLQQGVQVVTTPEYDFKPFFDHVRKPLFTRLTVQQVAGMETKIKKYKAAKWPLSWAAYGLATSYHETAHKMQPVREGLNNVSETWRKKNLRYYPHYGRGDVQLTWAENYSRADKELGLNGALVANLDLALDPEISAAIMIKGMEEGWFSGDKKGRHTLKRHIATENGTFKEFRNARRIINLMDKADQIAANAEVFRDGLIKMGY